MKNLLKSASLALAAIAAVAPAGQVLAQENVNFDFDINNVALSQDDSMAQVNSVFQLRDVAPSDWAFDALRNLVEKYNCIAGYPNGTFRGNRPLSRYEFAAGLNACLQQIERLIIGDSQDSNIATADITRLRALVQEFDAELKTLGARVDDIEGRVAFLEDNQFSTTTKLVGEVAFVLADAFGDQNADGAELEANTILQNKVRLQLVTSFTGKDKLYTRLTADNTGGSFNGEIGTNEGRFAHDTLSTNNNVIIDRLHYVFPLGKKTTVTTMARLGAHHFYADTFNKGLEAGGGAGGGLSRFSERNPIYRLGLFGSTTGIGLKHNFNDKFQASLGYLALNGSNPAEENGLFDGTYSALGQLVFKPSGKFKVGATYIRGYSVNAGQFNYLGTGTDLANGLGGLGGSGLNTDTFGLQGQFDISSKFSLRAWGGYTEVDAIGGGDGEIWNYAVAAVFPDLGKKGSMGAIVIGAEPYAGSLTDGTGANLATTNDTPLHIEGFYKYQLTKHISITPGIIWLTAPNQNNNNDDIVIGALRTTFKF